jgi:hypothetical protein
MSKQLILFNGPRHSGKDTAADHVWRTFDNVRRFKMSRPLKDGIKAFFNLTDAQVTYLENKKTEPDDLLFGRSYVDAHISLSEHWAKDFFGTTVFGRLAARDVQYSASPLLVCSDSGFDYEAAPLIRLVGKENTLLVRLHRPGKSFSGDSRSYVSLADVTTLDLHNSGKLHEFHQQVEQVVRAWLDR